jgi:hypothetical protein
MDFFVQIQKFDDKSGEARQVYSTEEIDSIVALTCCSNFGDGMADLVPGSRLGEKHSCIRPIFGSERAKLTSLCKISIERPV